MGIHHNCASVGSARRLHGRLESLLSRKLDGAVEVENQGVPFGLWRVGFSSKTPLATVLLNQNPVRNSPQMIYGLRSLIVMRFLWPTLASCRQSVPMLPT